MLCKVNEQLLVVPPYKAGILGNHSSEVRPRWLRMVNFDLGAS